MTQTIVEFFRNLFHNDIATVILIAMVPMIELRGAIPVGVAAGMKLWEAFGWAWLGSSLVAPILLLLLRPILNLLKKIKFFKRFIEALEQTFDAKAAKVAAKSNKKGFDPRAIERKKLLGTFAFVAVPAPLTGVWTGSAVAAFLGLPFWKSLLTVCAGNLVAGALITLLTMFLQDYIDYILYALLALVAVVIVYYIVKVVKTMRKSGGAATEDRRKADRNGVVENDASAQNAQPSLSQNSQGGAVTGDNDAASRAQRADCAPKAREDRDGKSVEKQSNPDTATCAPAVKQNGKRQKKKE